MNPHIVIGCAIIGGVLVLIVGMACVPVLERMPRLYARWVRKYTARKMREVDAAFDAALKTIQTENTEQSH